MRDRESEATAWNVRWAGLADFPAVEQLWVALYDHQKALGMFLEVAPGSFESWQASMSAALGRFTCLHVAELGGRMIGFTAGSVKTLPPFLGGLAVGFISEVFVDHAYRTKGVARALVTKTVEWFASQNVCRVELQVLMDNRNARRLYSSLGWREELVQMIWDLPAK